MRKSKQLVDTNGGATQTFTNTLLNNGTPVTAGTAYSITEKPAGLTNQITVNPTTGEVTFGAAALTKVNADGPQTVTVQAAHQGKTASYTFTVTDHFSPRRYHASAVLSGALYVIGGRTAAGRSNQVWRSGDGGLTWDQVAAGTAADSTLFAGRSSHTLEVIGDALYLLGGFDGANRFDDVWTSADRGVTWRQAAAATSRYPARSEHSSAVLGTTLYVIAGSESSGTVRDIWRSTNLGATWTQVTNFATFATFGSIRSHASVVVANRVYVIGGFHGTSDTDRVWRSDTDNVVNQDWTQVATGTRFSARRNHSAVVLDGAIYVIGGLPRDDEVWRSADQGVTWTQVATGARFSARHEHTSAALSGALYVIGGFDGTNRLNDVWKSTDQGVTWTNVHAAP